jgi:tocopherol cyclase
LLIRAALDRLLHAYRRTGADPPFSDPARGHRTGMEGYYWRIVDASAGRVVVCLCGVCRAEPEDWAVVACAAHPGGFLRHAVVAPAIALPEAFGVRAADVLRGSIDRIVLRLGDESWVDVHLRPRAAWSRPAFGALGPAHLVPGLTQYWHPVLLAAEVEGEACLGGSRVRLDEASAYVEKNWGPGFAGRWWWGHAGAFPSPEATVAFAGGDVSLLGWGVSPTAVVVRLGGEVLRLAPPLAAVSVDGWHVRARSARHSVDLQGEVGAEPHVLPVPDVVARRVDMRSEQHLAGRLHMSIRRGRRTLFDETSPLAGLELGVPRGSSASLRAAGGDRERLRSDQALEGPDDRPYGT